MSTTAESTRTNVAIQGEAGSFSHAAALALLGPDIRLTPCTSFERLFQDVSDGGASLGVVPIENSLAGSVTRNYDLLSEHSLNVVGETFLRVRLSLIGRPGAKPGKLTRVASHPVALSQCRRFFAEHPQLTQVAALDTARAVRDLMAGAADYDGAIGSTLAAQLYGGEVLREDLEDHEENYTRFLAVAREPLRRADASKVSIVFTLPNAPGALYKALGVFAARGIDLTKVESRPIVGRPWEYAFYLDWMAGRDEEGIRNVLNELGDIATSVRVLGYYPIARIIE